MAPKRGIQYGSNLFLKRDRPLTSYQGRTSRPAVASSRSSNAGLDGSRPASGASPSDSVLAPEARNATAASAMQASTAPGDPSDARRMRSRAQPPSSPVWLNVV